MNKKEEKIKTVADGIIEEIEKCIPKIMENVPKYFYVKIDVGADFFAVDNPLKKTFRGKKQ